MWPWSPHFYPRSPCGERRFTISAHCFDGRISIHALLAESDRQKLFAQWILFNFYPRSPCGERPRHLSLRCTHRPISIHALLAESDGIVNAFHGDLLNISIHALLAESDTARPVLMMTGPNISIHALLAESDCKGRSNSSAIRIFLSTLSLRRATGILVFCGPQGSDFYPRSPCGERHQEFACIAWQFTISIHALLAESDLPIYVMSASAVQISIHALLAESDCAVSVQVGGNV